MGLCSPWGCKELDMTEQLSLSLFTFNQQGPTAQHMELCSMLCGSLDARGFGREWIRVYLWLSPFTAHLRLTQLLIGYQFSSVQSLSHVRLFATPWIAARQASLSITNSQSLLKHMSIESMMPSSHLILCCPLLLLPPSPPSIRVFSNESTLHMSWPRYSSFSFSISPSNEHPGLISFRMDWLDLLAVQGTLKTLLQHQSSIHNKKLKKIVLTISVSWLLYFL